MLDLHCTCISNLNGIPTAHNRLQRVQKDTADRIKKIVADYRHRPIIITDYPRGIAHNLSLQN